MTTPKKPTESTEQHKDVLQPELEEMIRRRAYEIYQARGSEDGHEMDHWLEAEKEIRAEQSPSMAA